MLHLLPLIWVIFLAILKASAEAVKIVGKH